MPCSLPLSMITENSMTISENYLCAVTSATKTRGNSLPPYHISEFMARATLEESLIKEKAEKDDILTISNPCCGGGCLLITALDVLKSLGVNYARNYFIDCGDINIRCIHMTYPPAFSCRPICLKSDDRTYAYFDVTDFTPRF